MFEPTTTDAPNTAEAHAAAHIFICELNLCCELKSKNPVKIKKFIVRSPDILGDTHARYTTCAPMTVGAPTTTKPPETINYSKPRVPYVNMS